MPAKPPNTQHPTFLLPPALRPRPRPHPPYRSRIANREISPPSSQPPPPIEIYGDNFHTQSHQSFRCPHGSAPAAAAGLLVTTRSQRSAVFALDVVAGACGGAVPTSRARLARIHDVAMERQDAFSAGFDGL
ncbi:hypothetical protein B7494_g6101 [Chlorociboria aeruginascens]|nr:hypothetical protein B7494_g6101 [Chlorociboria aeruginascens]